jgi:hypothetical protein
MTMYNGFHMSADGSGSLLRRVVDELNHRQEKYPIEKVIAVVPIYRYDDLVAYEVFYQTKPSSLT